MLILQLIFAIVLPYFTTAHNTKMVITLLRHGARNSRAKIENKGEASQLTEIGMQMCLYMGKLLRKRFPNFFSNTYYPEENLLFSSSKDRAFISAQSYLTGLYQESDRNINTDLDPRFLKHEWMLSASKVFLTNNLKGFKYYWMSSVFPEDDYFINPHNKHVCPGIKVHDKFTDSELAQQLKKRIQDIVPKLYFEGLDLSKIIGDNPVDSLHSYDSMMDFLMAKRFKSYGREQKVPEDIWNEAQRLHSLEVWLKFYSDPTRSAYYMSEFGRRLVQQLTEAKSAIASGKTPPKLVLYAGHSRMLMNYLLATNNFKVNCLSDDKDRQNECDFIPPYASVIIWELFEANGVLFVEAKYNDILIKVCGDKFQCPLDEFIKSTISLGLEGDIKQLRKQHCLGKSGSENLALKWIVAFNFVAIGILVGTVWFLKHKLKALG